MTLSHDETGGEREVGESWHLNFRWSLAQMDKIETLARRGLVADDIAFEMDTTSVEIKRLCARNHIHLRPMRKPARLPSVSIQRVE